MRAEILCVGTELLLGQTVNTNASYLAQELAALGIDCYWVTTVGDNFERLGAALATAWARADLVITTGGLGPTTDDITIEAIARFLGEPLAERPEVRVHIEGLFKRRNRPMVASNYKQTLFPPSAELIPNPTGTAYGLFVQREDKRLMTFPGVPFELKHMWRAWAQPRLAAATSGAVIRSALLKFVGIGESALAERVAPWLEGQNPTVAPYASLGEVHLRVTAKAHSGDDADALMAPAIAELTALRPFYYGRDDETLPSVVGRMLQDHAWSLGAAESCTGGLFASRITDVPGSSTYFNGSVVCYTNAIKMKLAGVSHEVLDRDGPVSESVARQLALGAQRALGSNWGVGITGYASGGAGVPPEDVGLVWIATADPSGTAIAEAFRFGAHTPREMIKHYAAQSALDMLRRRMED